MRSTLSKPSRLFNVEIWVARGGGDVTDLNRGEPNLTYHIRLHSLRKPSKTVYLKSVAQRAGGSNPLVTFPHNNFLEWVCSVRARKVQPGTDHHLIDVDQTNTGSTTLHALELVMVDPFRAKKETVTLDLPLTVI